MTDLLKRVRDRLNARLVPCPDSGCRVWTGPKDRQGYGLFWMRGRTHRAHRASWEVSNGPIPPGSFVLHKCDTPSCCNPSHLFLGSNNDNVKDMVKKGRHRKKLTVDQVRAIRKEYAAGGVYQKDLAERYGVGQTSISQAVRGTTWKYVKQRAAIAASEGVDRGE